MSHLPAPPPENVAAKKWVPVLIIGILGIVAIIGLYYLNPAFQLVDFLMMLLTVTVCALGYTRGIVRGVLTIIVLYIATGISALLYRGAAPFVNAVLQTLSGNLGATVDDPAGRGAQAFTFMLLTVVFWGFLELLRRAFFQATDLPEVGILDNLGGALVHIGVGILIATLLFNAYGYGQSRPAHDKALLRPQFNQVLSVLTSAQSFWFSDLPPIYSYDLDAR
jgi:hypothetical protein